MDKSLSECYERFTGGIPKGIFEETKEKNPSKILEEVLKNQKKNETIPGGFSEESLQDFPKQTWKDHVEIFGRIPEGMFEEFTKTPLEEFSKIFLA